MVSSPSREPSSAVSGTWAPNAGTADVGRWSPPSVGTRAEWPLSRTCRMASQADIYSLGLGLLSSLSSSYSFILLVCSNVNGQVQRPSTQQVRQLHSDLHWLDVPTTNWTLLCIAACRRKLRGTWSTVAHQFRKSPAVDNYAQSVDNTLLCHRVTGWACSGAFGPFRSPVILRGILYRIVSVIQHWVLTVFKDTT